MAAILPINHLLGHSQNSCREVGISYPQGQEEEYCRELILGNDRVPDILPLWVSWAVWLAMTDASHFLKIENDNEEVLVTRNTVVWGEPTGCRSIRDCFRRR